MKQKKICQQIGKNYEIVRNQLFELIEINLPNYTFFMRYSTQFCDFTLNGIRLPLSLIYEKFINFDCSEKKILNIIKSTSFEKLKKTEEIEGFEEASNSSIKFFNLGPNNNWKNVLNKNLINNIEKNFNKEMKELRYI